MHNPNLSRTSSENPDTKNGRMTLQAIRAKEQEKAFDELIGPRIANSRGQSHNGANQVNKSKIGEKTKKRLAALAGVAAAAAIIAFTTTPDDQTNIAPGAEAIATEPEANQDTIADTFGDTVSDIDGEAHGFAPNDTWDLSSTDASTDIDGEAYGFAPNDTWELSSNSFTGYEILDRAIDGSFSQYDNIGCYGNKTAEVNPHAVGDTAMILREMGINPEEATPEQLGAVTQYLAYSMAQPAASIAISMDFDGFAGLSQREAEDKITNMLPEEKAKLQNELANYFSKTSYSFDTGNGLYKNQGIYEDEDGNKHSEYRENDLTGKRILVASTTLDDGTTVVILYKDDCGNNVDTIIIIRPDGTTVTIQITYENEPKSTKDTKPESEDSRPTSDTTSTTTTDETTPTPTPTPETPTPTPTPEPPKPTPTITPTPVTPTPEEIKQKDAENLDRIDKQIEEKIENDIENTEQININSTTVEETREQPITEQSVVDEAPAIVEREPEPEPESPPPAKVEATVPDNNYSTNDNGAYTPNENLEAQFIADQSATPVVDDSWQNDLGGILNDLGVEYSEE